MRFTLKVQRDARALVILIRPARPMLDVLIAEGFVVCPCDVDDFDEALRYAQTHVALPTFLVGGDFAVTVAEKVPNLRGVVAWSATDAVIGAASRLQVPLLLIGGSAAIASAAHDASRLIIESDHEREMLLAASVTARFIGAYAS